MMATTILNLTSKEHFRNPQTLFVPGVVDLLNMKRVLTNSPLLYRFLSTNLVQQKVSFGTLVKPYGPEIDALAKPFDSGNF